ncbi:putative LRR receptor-like serine/threonine-protein kinase At2g16250 [Bidens hawaiensis]|uniref:putative LRR receptor-like serine/threonine-protein kinase At2g16250 n=1 Tax=Bidens hawaiensis TaxID=980011 RepID=UPI00404961AE
MSHNNNNILVAISLIFFFFNSTFQQSFNNNNNTARFRAERAALLQIRSTLGIRSKQWPIKSNHCTNWVGITCQNGTVSGINISGFKRTRIGNKNPQFSIDFTNLTNLVFFNASNFPLPGSIPVQFATQLPNLQILDLRVCRIIGSVPDSFSGLTNLGVLYLSGNSLSGSVPDSLGLLTRLSVLDLSNNTLTGSIPDSFGSLTSISMLDMSLNYLSGVIPESLGNLPNLRVLNFSGNSLSGSVAMLSNVTTLVFLDLGSNAFSGELPKEFKRLTSLQRLVVRKNVLTGNLSGELFSDGSKLESLVLDHNNFTGEIPSALWGVSGLRFVDISVNNFTGELPKVGNFTSRVLNLSHNMFYGNIMPVLRSFDSVDLSYNYLQGKVPDYLRNGSRGVVSLNRNCLRNTTGQKTVRECATFYSLKGLQFDNFGLPNGTVPSPPRGGDGDSNRKWIILAAVLGGVGLVILLAIVVLIVVCCRKRPAASQRGTGVGPAPAAAEPPPPEVAAAVLNLARLGDSFTYKQILAATNDLSPENLIKKGHAADIFKGVLEGGTFVVVKRFEMGPGKEDKCMVELDFFSKVAHARLVPLLGYCLENENAKFLVYGHMPNGDLAGSMYRISDEDDDSLQSLDWITRLKIALDAAEALTFLHHDCVPPIVHRDVQASSILLDDKYEVRFGSLSEVCVQEGDSHSSRFTRLLRLPQTSEQGASGQATATCAYDVYCFGKVLLELVTGKMGISASNDSSTKELLDSILPYINIYDKELVTNIVDPSLIIDEDLLEEVWAMAVVARSCLNPKPARRPLMRYVFKALENPLKVVREESGSSARMRTPSSRGSWNAALFSSWRQQSSVDVAVGAGPSSLKRSGTSGSQSGSGGQNGNNGDHSSSNRKHSKDVFPEPLDAQDEARSDSGH